MVSSLDNTLTGYYLFLRGISEKIHCKYCMVLVLHGCIYVSHTAREQDPYYHTVESQCTDGIWMMEKKRSIKTVFAHGLSHTRSLKTHLKSQRLIEILKIKLVLHLLTSTYITMQHRFPIHKTNATPSHKMDKRRSYYIQSLSVSQLDHSGLQWVHKYTLQRLVVSLNSYTSKKIQASYLKLPPAYTHHVHKIN